MEKSRSHLQGIDAIIERDLRRTHDMLFLDSHLKESFPHSPYFQRRVQKIALLEFPEPA